MTDDIASRSLSDRIVLLCLVDLELSGATPTHTGRVVRATKAHLESVEAETLGRVSEAEVNRALNRLDADGLVEMVDPDDRSPTGKGRPAYALVADAETIVAALSTDDRVAALAERVQ